VTRDKRGSGTLGTWKIDGLFCRVTGLCLLVMFLLVTTGGSRGASAEAAEDLNVVARVDKTEVAAGETLNFVVTIEGSIQATPRVQLTGFEGFQIVSTAQSQQLQVRPDEARLTLTLTYTLAPTIPGTHTLGPVQVEYAGRVIQANPIEVTVLPGPPGGKPNPKGIPPLQKSAPLRKKPESQPERMDTPSDRRRSPSLEGGVIL
jgi:hypothetical protein